MLFFLFHDLLLCSRSFILWIIFWWRIIRTWSLLAKHVSIFWRNKLRSIISLITEVWSLLGYLELTHLFLHILRGAIFCFILLISPILRIWTRDLGINGRLRIFWILCLHLYLISLLIYLLLLLTNLDLLLILFICLLCLRDSLKDIQNILIGLLLLLLLNWFLLRLNLLVLRLLGRMMLADLRIWNMLGLDNAIAI